MSRNTLDPAIEAAIDWMVRLGSGDVSDHDRRAFDTWLQQPANRLGWERVSGMLDAPLQQFGSASAHHPEHARAASQVLARPAVDPQRRRLLGGGSALLVLLGLGAFGVRREHLLADIRTGLGERRRIQLVDGSELILNAESAVDLRLEAGQRRVVLLRGELLVQVAADPARPFIVQCAEGHVRALGTRFSVRQMDGASLVAVQEHSVEVSSVGGQRRVLEQGQALRLERGGMSLQADQGDPAAWTKGLLDLRDTPLAQMIDALRPYHRGFIRVAPEVARLRVYGVFPLDDSERALLALAETLPVTIRRYGPFTLIDGRQAK